MEIEALHSLFLNSTGVTTDTRKIESGKLFFALKGENFNGNEFAAKALAAGACYAVIDEKEYETDDRCLLVDDVLSELQALACYHRSQLKIPVIGITGSNAKTTTKELMRDVLAKKYRVLATKGNLNNHIGVPLTLLELTQKHEIAIIEMGASHVNEIELLSEIADPDFGLITNIGQAHIGEFGGQENIIKGKCELYDHLRARKGMVFVNGGSDLLLTKSEDLSRTMYGTHGLSTADCQLISSDPFLTFDWNHARVETQLIGDYNLINITAAIAVGLFFGVTPSDICSAVAAYHPDNNRSQLVVRGNTRFIMDAYNANPDSMNVALQNLSTMSAENKLAILGDMLELGDESASAHRTVIDTVEALGIETLFVGAEFMAQGNGGTSYYSDAQAVKSALTDYNLTDALILIKGSRGIRLESILEEIPD